MMKRLKTKQTSKQTSKRTTAALLLALALALISGCAKTGGEETAAPSANPNEGKPVPGIFTSEKIDLGIEGAENAYINNINVVGERLYYGLTKSETATDEDGNYSYSQEASVMSAKLDGSDRIVVFGPVVSAYDAAQKRNEQTSLYGFESDREGNLWILTLYTIDDQTDPLAPVYERRYELKKYSPDGAELASIDLASVPDFDANGNIQAFFLDGAGNLYASLYSGMGGGFKICVFSGETGAYAFAVNETDYVQSLFVLNTGEVAYTTFPMAGGSGYKLKVIDFAAKTANEKPAPGNLGYGSQMSGSGDYAYYYFMPGALYGYKLETQSSEPVVRLLDSGIAADHVRGVAPTGDGGFVANIMSQSGIASDGGVFLLMPNLDPTLASKRVITLGGLSLGTDARRAAVEFNRTSTSARITFKDYSEYSTPENYLAGATQLDLDILGGKAPDIIFTSSLSVRKYTAKGLFADLYPLLDADTKLRREDLFENILKIGEYDGKLTNVITTFQINALGGKKSVFGDGGSITAAELTAVADKNPDAKIMLNTTDDGWLREAVQTSVNDFVDWGTGVCTFNSEEFIALLEFSKRFPKDIDNSLNYATSYEEYMALATENMNALREGRVLLNRQYIYSPRAIHSLREVLGDDAVFLGFTAKGKGGASIMGASGYAVSASSPYKEEAWSFISHMLQKSAPDEGYSDSFILHTNKGVFEKQAEAEMIPLLERDLSKGVAVTITMLDGSSASTVRSVTELKQFAQQVEGQGKNVDEWIASYHLTEEDVAAVRNVIESAERAVTYSEQQITDIVMEEAEAFWAGAKTAEETANVIQSRVQIYVSEGM
ncbi:MAG: extracellular solute-binding protein [Oscillospiraceae bacterium]|jgi:ABC-type glycerol-3-phosphate transport system substrate-binding protein|nr:extracellular solute-binding protein [Oscillospiraceae bacterium]